MADSIFCHLAKAWESASGQRISLRGSAVNSSIIGGRSDRQIKPHWCLRTIGSRPNDDAHNKGPRLPVPVGEDQERVTMHGRSNKSLDASGGCAFLNLLHAAQ